MAPKLSPGQLAYWHNKLPGASMKTILQARGKQIFNHNPDAVVPGSGLTPMRLNADVNAAVQPLTSVQSQVPGWYQAYRAQLNSAIGQAQQTYGNLGSQIASSPAANQNASQTSKNLTALQEQALARGGTSDPALASLAQGALTGQNALQQGAASFAGAQGQNQTNYINDLLANSQLQEGASLKNLAGQIAAGKQTARASEIHQAQTYALGKGALDISGVNAATSRQNANTAAGAAQSLAANRRSTTRLNSKKLNEKTSNDAALLHLKNRAANLADSKNTLANDQFAAKYGITPQHFSNLTDPQKLSYLKRNKITIGSKGGLSSKAGGPTAGELGTSRKLTGNLENAINTVHQAIGAGSKDPSAIKQALTLPKKAATGSSPGNPFGGYDAVLAQAAIDIVFNPEHRLSRKTFNTLTNLGMIVPGRWKPVKSGAQSEPNS